MWNDGSPVTFKPHLWRDKKKVTLRLPDHNSTIDFSSLGTLLNGQTCYVIINFGQGMEWKQVNCNYTFRYGKVLCKSIHPATFLPMDNIHRYMKEKSSFYDLMMNYRLNTQGKAFRHKCPDGMMMLISTDYKKPDFCYKTLFEHGRVHQTN